ncbi:TIGR03089 family protein [Paenarthrobacter sp. Z7-10]|uniref:TIGR03089 family protein n=1 Tax=Paenarthrobacter sp. Z7-10 TaxID=2787635 RepID=UPI0022A992CE|nr:TIGR03089 family protein [Paenarthrobacter sp. Z7-10]MCZ2403248.1 TIGR03089 family protein [Paenarthrobacter sp. Z7-10]
MTSPSSSIATLMAALRQRDPTAPRLTWYGPQQERIELSGRVLDNWAAKTANFLTDELDAEPGTTLLLDLPAHWKSLCWALAGWQCGTNLWLSPESPGAAPVEIAATSRPEDSPPAATTVAVALGALDMRWRGALPAGMVDYADQVRAHGDVFAPFAKASDNDVALMAAGQEITYGDLLTDYSKPAAKPGRVLLQTDLLEKAVRAALGIWAGGGSLVLVHPDVEVTEALINSEKVTVS